ncbi:hypothetical protein [Paenibacillus antarcticus]|uniref:LXG domain-containing protein n=1 Tax=Paenibacillus antarcticus TaxID=253703 RepID=A0A168R2B1_9BACL|nr:hypothetical protein [Paenibacillus antarcticus]OAB48496.1 hypothetical protein PBAT_02360 [Paenibacillus antarcticus]
MKALQEAIQKLEDLQQSSKGSFVGAGDEIIIFMRHDLQVVIDNLKDVHNSLKNEKVTTAATEITRIKHFRNISRSI